MKSLLASNKPINNKSKGTVLQMTAKKIPRPTSLITAAFKRSSTTYVTRPFKVTEDDHRRQEAILKLQFSFLLITSYTPVL